MAAVAVNGAKRSLRSELKQRLRALSAEERQRQSYLLTQKVREDGRELHSGEVGLASPRKRTSPGRVHVLGGARSAGGGGLRIATELLPERGSRQVCSFKPSYFVIARKGVAAVRRCRDCRVTLRFK